MTPAPIKLTIRAEFGARLASQVREFVIEFVDGKLCIREAHADEGRRPYASTTVGEAPGIDLELQVERMRPEDERVPFDRRSLKGGHT